MNKSKYRQYKSELRQRAVDLAEEIGPARAGRVLGIDGDLVRKWQTRSREGRYMSKNDTSEETALVVANRELRRLNLENEDLKKANIILKELASVFSKDPLSSSLGWSLNSTNDKKQK